MTSETVVVELEREEVEGLLAFSGGDPNAEDCNPDVCATCRARGKLITALASDSPEGEIGWFSVEDMRLLHLAASTSATPEHLGGGKR